jgi:hypothetical protein
MCWTNLVCPMQIRVEPVCPEAGGRTYHRGVSGPSVTARPAICLNMIVRNEAHIIAETLDSVARYITSWVIVDTGSNDGTQNLI